MKNTLKEQLEETYGMKAAPLYLPKRCAARKSRAEPCSTCVQVCPEQVFPSGKRKHPDWDRYTHCGVCAGACPTRCITPPVDRVKSFLMALAKRGPLSMGCDTDEHSFRLSLRCLAAASWEQMACAALHEGVVVSLRACEACSRQAEKDAIRENLRRLRQFLGETRFRERVTILTDEEPDYVPQEAVMSRRELLRFSGGLTLDRAFSLLPAMDEKQDSSLFYRALLRDMVEQTETGAKSGEKYGLALPRFQSSCYGCGYCVQACPSKALKLLPGDGTFTMAVEAWKCTGCGICRNTCREEGIAGIMPVKISHLGTVALTKLKQHCCPQCGAPYPRTDDAEVCAACASREQARQRREKRKNQAGKTDG